MSGQTPWATFLSKRQNSTHSDTRWSRILNKSKWPATLFMLFNKCRKQEKTATSPELAKEWDYMKSYPLPKKQRMWPRLVQAYNYCLSERVENWAIPSVRYRPHHLVPHLKAFTDAYGKRYTTLAHSLRMSLLTPSETSKPQPSSAKCRTPSLNVK